MKITVIKKVIGAGVQAQKHNPLQLLKEAEKIAETSAKNAQHKTLCPHEFYDIKGKKEVFINPVILDRKG